MNVIQTHDLTRRYGATEAVHALNLAVPAGSVCALLGPNGAGKTTTLKLLMNLLRPTSGRAEVLGIDTSKLGEREFAQIGYVSENQQLPLWMTVQQLLDYCRPFYPTWDRGLEKQLLAQFQLPVDRRLQQLSRGMLMKAALLASLAYRPRLLVLDEPFSGLDPLVREEFVHGLLEVSTQGDWTVLVSSHDVDDVERLVDRIAFIGTGRLRLNEPTEELQGRFRRVEVTGGNGSAAARAAAGEIEWAQSGQLTRFIATAYAGETTERDWRSRFPGATFNTQPMSLREIFVALARTPANDVPGGAA